MQLYPPELHNIPADAPLTLVGEAKAFLYPRKLGMLRYRTVFDVDTTSTTNLVDAWRGQPIANEWLLVDPVELERFSQTYFGIPAPPAEVRARTGPYVVPPTGIPPRNGERVRPADTARTPPTGLRRRPPAPSR